jgi:hypothetical protein
MGKLILGALRKRPTWGVILMLLSLAVLPLVGGLTGTPEFTRAQLVIIDTIIISYLIMGMRNARSIKDHGSWSILAISLLVLFIWVVIGSLVIRIPPGGAQFFGELALCLITGAAVFFITFGLNNLRRLCVDVAMGMQVLYLIIATWSIPWLVTEVLWGGIGKVVTGAVLAFEWRLFLPPTFVSAKAFVETDLSLLLVLGLNAAFLKIFTKRQEGVASPWGRRSSPPVVQPMHPEPTRPVSVQEEPRPRRQNPRSLAPNTPQRLLPGPKQQEIGPGEQQRLRPKTRPQRQQPTADDVYVVDDDDGEERGARRSPMVEKGTVVEFVGKISGYETEGEEDALVKRKALLQGIVGYQGNVPIVLAVTADGDELGVVDQGGYFWPFQVVPLPTTYSLIKDEAQLLVERALTINEDDILYGRK